MPLGYCMECQRLTGIHPVALKLGSRVCEWQPIPHDALVHVDCPIISDADPKRVAVVVDGKCTGCGATGEFRMRLAPCPGVQRDIR